MDLSQIKQEQINTDVLVIGGGIAGIFAAIKARENGANVAMAVKGYVFRSGCSPFFGGFCVFDESVGHKKQEWIDIVSSNGEYVNNLSALEALISDSLGRHKELEAWGALENRHVLRKKLKDDGVKLLERVMITDLITKDGNVVGAVGFPFEEDKMIVIRAGAVVMATGAGSFKSDGFPIASLTHDGDAMAFRIGAEITGKEYVDTHFTSMENPAQGTFAVEIGIKTMASARLHPFLDMSRELQAHDGEIPVSMPRMRPPGDRPGGPPGGRSPGPEGPGKGPDMSGGILGSAAAGLGNHKSEGIWAVDDNYASQIPGLYSAGDSCGSMLGGAKYALLGSSSTGSAVQGARSGKAAADYAAKVNRPEIANSEIEKLKEVTFGPRTREKGYSPTWVTRLLQNTMIPYYVTFVKKEDRLNAAITTIEFLRDHFAPKLVAKTTHDLRLAHDLRNMLVNAEMKLRASLFRTESRGVHYREDFPARDDKNWLAWILIGQDKNGNMALRKESVPKEWHPDQSIPYEKRYPDRFPGELEFLKGKSA